MREKVIAKMTQGFGLNQQADGGGTFTETGKIRVRGERAQDKVSFSLPEREDNQEEGLAGAWSHRSGVQV